MKWTTNAPIHATRTNESKANNDCQNALALFLLAVMVAGMVLEAVWR